MTTAEEELSNRQYQLESLVRESRVMARTIRRLHADIESRDMRLRAESAKVQELQAELNSRSLEASSAKASSPSSQGSATGKRTSSPSFQGGKKASSPSAARYSVDAASNSPHAQLDSPSGDSARMTQLRVESAGHCGQLFKSRSDSGKCIAHPEDDRCAELAFELNTQSQTLREELLRLQNELGQRAADAAVREEEMHEVVISLQSELQTEIATARAAFSEGNRMCDRSFQMQLSTARAQFHEMIDEAVALGKIVEPGNPRSRSSEPCACDDLQVELAAARAQIEKQQHDLAASHATITKLQVESATSAAELAAARDQIKKKQKELTETHATIKELQNGSAVSADEMLKPCSCTFDTLDSAENGVEGGPDHDVLALGKADILANASAKGTTNDLAQPDDALNSLCERFAALRRATQDLPEVDESSPTDMRIQTIRHSSSGESATRQEPVSTRKYDVDRQAQSKENLDPEGVTVRVDMANSTMGKIKINNKVLGSRLNSPVCSEGNAEQQWNSLTQAVMMNEEPSAIFCTDTLSNGDSMWAPDYSFTSSQNGVRGCPSSCGVCEECEWYMMSPIPSPTFGMFAKEPRERKTHTRLGWNINTATLKHEVESCDELANSQASIANDSQGVDMRRIPNSPAPHALHTFQQDDLKVVSKVVQVGDVAANPDVGVGVCEVGFSQGSTAVELTPKKTSNVLSANEETQLLDPATKSHTLGSPRGMYSEEEEHVWDDAHHRSSEPWLSRTPVSPCSHSSGCLHAVYDESPSFSLGSNARLDIDDGVQEESHAGHLGSCTENLEDRLQRLRAEALNSIAQLQACRPE